MDVSGSMSSDDIEKACSRTVTESNSDDLVVFFDRDASGPFQVDDMEKVLKSSSLFGRGGTDATNALHLIEKHANGTPHIKVLVSDGFLVPEDLNKFDQRIIV